MSIARSGIAALALWLAPALTLSAPAAIITFSDLPSFLSASGPTSFESFEQTPLLPFQANPPLDVGPFTFTTNDSFGIVTTGPSLGQHPTDGVRYLGLLSRGGSFTFRFTFAPPIRALGLDFIDFGDQPLDLGAMLFMIAPSLVTIKQTTIETSNGNVFFFGFVSDDPVTEVTFRTSHGDNMAMDSLRYSSVPEPSADLMLAFGASCLRFRRRGD